MQELKTLQEVLRRLTKEESGQGMTEYGLILALIAVAAIVALVLMGGKLSNMFGTTANNIN